MSGTSDFLAAVRGSITKRELIPDGAHVLLAVSGGADSLALLHGMHRLAPEFGWTLSVAHFDHRWRPGSADDAAFVREQAARLDLPFHGGEGNPAPVKGQSPEESARNQRMQYLADTARAIGATRIATGHTFNDQAETVLMRVLVGAGKRGLSGIPPRRWYWVRPLLDVRREQVETFCQALRLRPVMDPSNEDPAFLRNQIRHETLPYLRSTINARLDEQLVRLADISRDEDYYLDQQASMVAIPEPIDGGSRLDIERLRSIPVPLQRRAIRLLARNEGPGIDAERTEAVREMALDGRTGARLDLPGPLTARVEYGFLVIGEPETKRRARKTILLAVPGDTELVSWGLRMHTWISTDAPSAFPDGRQTCVLDADRTPLPLRVRRVAPGDRFTPFGMARQKKVGDFFTDAKVPARTRGEVPLVVSDDDRIVWIGGHRIDERAKVSATTRSFLWMSLEGKG